MSEPQRCPGIAGLEHAIDLSTSSGEADSENTSDDSESDEVSIADLVSSFSEGLKLEHAFPVFYKDIEESGGEYSDPPLQHEACPQTDYSGKTLVSCGHYFCKAL